MHRMPSVAGLFPQKSCEFYGSVAEIDMIRHPMHLRHPVHTHVDRQKANIVCLYMCVRVCVCEYIYIRWVNMCCLLSIRLRVIYITGTRSCIHLDTYIKTWIHLHIHTNIPICTLHVTVFFIKVLACWAHGWEIPDIKNQNTCAYEGEISEIKKPEHMCQLKHQSPDTYYAHRHTHTHTHTQIHTWQRQHEQGLIVRRCVL